MLARNIHDEDTIELQLSPAELEGLTRAAEAAEAAEVQRAPEARRASETPEVPGAAERESPARAPAPLPVIASANTPALLPTAAHNLRSENSPAAAAVRATLERAPELVPAGSPQRQQPQQAQPLPEPSSPPHQTGRQFLGLQVAAAFAVAVAALVALFYYWPTPPASAPATSPVAPPATITAPAHEAAHQSAPTPPAVELTTNEPGPVRFPNPFDASEIFEFPPGTPYDEARDEVARQLLARARERSTIPPPNRKTTATNRPDAPDNEASLARQL